MKIDPVGQFTMGFKIPYDTGHGSNTNTCQNAGPTFFQNKSSKHPHIYLIFMIQMFMNVFLQFVFVRRFFFALKS